MKQVWERNIPELEHLLADYPWFTSARRLLAILTGESDPALALPVMFWPTIPPKPKAPGEAVSPEDALIARFLAHGAYRIVPDDGAAVEDVVTEERFDAADGEFETGELAEIYRAQGLMREARALSRK